MPSTDILVLEDEAALRGLIAETLTREGFTVREAGDVGAAERALSERWPDLLLVDWMLPGVSGIDFTRRLRLTGRGRTIPLLILTARGAEEDRVKGLESGADDYLVKPFSPRELVARLHALLRRSARAGGGARTEAADRVRVGSLDLDAAACRIDASGQPLDLAPAEYRLLQFFMRHTDRVYGRSELLDAVWGNDRFISERTVDVHVARLRRVLESAGVGGYLQTVRSVGYRFSEPVDA